MFKRESAQTIINNIYKLQQQCSLDDSALLHIFLNCVQDETLTHLNTILELYPIIEFIENDLGADHWEFVDTQRSIFNISTQYSKKQCVQILNKLDACQDFIKNKSKEMAIDELLSIIETGQIPKYENIGNYYVRIINETEN